MVGAQYAWMKEDLKRVDRRVTPWLVATWHPPWYNSYSSHYQEFECMRQEMEALLYQHGVDIIFTGHVCGYPPPHILWNLLACSNVLGFTCLLTPNSPRIIVHKVFSCSCVCSVFFFLCTHSVHYEPDGSSSL